MSDELQGKKIAILAADGVEQVELEQPRRAVEENDPSAAIRHLVSFGPSNQLSGSAMAASPKVSFTSTRT